MKTIVFLISLFISLSSVAADKNQLYIAVSPASCEEWNLHRKAKDYTASIYTYWITGYISAYNAATDNVYDILGSTDIKQIYTKMDKYCGKNPKSHLADGMSHIIMRLWPNRHNALVKTLK